MLYKNKLSNQRNILDFVYWLDGTDSWGLVLELQKCLLVHMTQNFTVVDIRQFFLRIVVRYMNLCKGNIFGQEIEKVSELDVKS